MKIHDFSDLLHLNVRGHIETNGTLTQLTLHTDADEQRLYFGLPYYTAARPLFISGLMTEKNTLLRAPLLFTWIEENFIREPRAEIFGMTADGEQPVMFMRDFDLDRPREMWLRCGEPARWVKLNTVLLSGRTLMGEAGALDALSMALPSIAQDFIATVRTDVSSGHSLKAALRTRRKSTNAAWMALADGWRIVMTTLT
ncbi:MAG: hypothetical protein NTZ50_01270 [Chloroflexi bacterium]|nr:hypothetical protein [Chloroflexota bacterium]